MSPSRIFETVFIVCLLTVAIWSAGRPMAQTPAAPTENRIEVHVYSQPGCPFCQRAKDFLFTARDGRDWLIIIDHDIQTDPVALQEFKALNELLSIATPGVPLIFVGPQIFGGFDRAATTGTEILATANRCRGGPCRDLRSELLAQARGTVGPEPDGSIAVPLPASKEADLPDHINLPFFGPLETKALSLPVLTILLAAIDGFNPCAMWVLVFLIGLLLGMKDRARMWTLGAAFLLTSALVYFLFLAAWLNVFLFLGSLLWIRLLVGGFALAAGLYYLHEFALHSETYCRVTNVEQRRWIMDVAKRVVAEGHVFYALGGIVLLAAAVNLIELLCSAGLPAVFANILSLSDLPIWQYYAFLLLYIIVFLADDALIFVTAMMTLQASGLAGTYSRYSQLLGGCIMLVIGLLLIFRPAWLSFG
jgi:glutaredoxin